MYFEYYAMGFILIPGIILSIIAEIKVHSSYNKFSEVASSFGKSAAQVARLFLDNAGLSHISITQVSGHLTDYYNHRTKTIGLSDSVHDSTSISAIGIACHEVGHAIQYKTKYLPIRIRNLIIPVCNFANKFLLLFIILGVIFAYLNVGTTFLWIGIGIFTLSVLVNLITLPVEFNASKRATELLEKSTIFDSDEVAGTKEVLNAAALTYVAGLVVSLLNLLRLILLVTRRNDD